MVEMRFEWDPRKSLSNFRKHDITFDEAKSAFFDTEAIVFFDPDHSEVEDRFILLGRTTKSNVVVVCHCLRESETVVRIISARKADKREEIDYWEMRL